MFIPFLYVNVTEWEIKHSPIVSLGGLMLVLSSSFVLISKPWGNTIQLLHSFPLSCIMSYANNIMQLFGQIKLHLKSEFKSCKRLALMNITLLLYWAFPYTAQCFNRDTTPKHMRKKQHIHKNDMHTHKVSNLKLNMIMYWKHSCFNFCKINHAALLWMPCKWSSSLISKFLIQIICLMQ